MPKRPRSPSPLPPSKHQHTSQHSACHVARPTSRTSFDTCLSDELIFYIFSYLSWVDLCTAQTTNRKWSRLATDNQLWKTLYLREFGRSRLRGGRGYVSREVQRSREREATNERDWKWMFRISSNWRTGRCTVEKWKPSAEMSQASSSRGRYLTHVLLAGSITIVASAQPCDSPAVEIHSPNRLTHSISFGLPVGQASTHVTALAVDQAPPDFEDSLRIVAFLSSGRFSVFTIDRNAPSSSFRTLTYIPATKTSRTSPIIQAVYHHPLLITLSEEFHLSIYNLSFDTISHDQTLTSFTSSPPTSLVLSAPSASTYRLILAYAIPVYPAHWSVGATELIISAAPDSLRVVKTRSTRAFDVPNGWIDGRRLQSMREQWGRKVPRVADTQTDGKWVVLAPAAAITSTSAPPSPSSHPSESSPSGSPFVSSGLHSPTHLQLYRLHLPPQHSSSSAPKLVFVRDLYGPVGPISSLALSDGRCVCLGINGSIWVWDLEADIGTEVAQGSILGPAPGIGVDVFFPGRRGTVVFDERQIITDGLAGLEIRLFDI